VERLRDPLFLVPRGDDDREGGQPPLGGVRESSRYGLTRSVKIMKPITRPGM